MKKLIFTVALGLSLTSAFAQGEGDRVAGTSTKGGQYILPQTGDFAIGVTANSFLEYAGNAFNTSHNNAPVFGFKDNVFNGTTIYGKYFLSEQTAVRVKLNIGFNSDKEKALVQDDNNPADPKALVEDSYKLSSSGLGLRVGYEMRRGYGRLQGFYGAEVGLGISSQNNKSFDYQNAMDKNDGATSASFAGTNNTGNIVGATGKAKRRTLSEKNGSTFSAILGAFVGVEYFIAPKLSVGGELGLGLLLQSTGKGSKEVQEAKLVNGSNAVVTEKSETAGSGHSSFSTDANYTGSLNLIFHF